MSLKALLRAHLAQPLPNSVEKGGACGGVDPVMVGPDLYGSCSTVADGGRLSTTDTQRLRLLRDDLQHSLDQFPDDAQPYYAGLVEMASVALLLQP